MIPQQTFENYPVFGDNATKVKPDDAKYAAGFQQADVLPAEWMNWAWNKNTQGINELQQGLTSVEAEIGSVLANRNITPDGSSVSQLLTALQSFKAEAILAAHPVGSLYWTTSNENPAVTFGGGTWKQIKDRFILAAGDTYTTINETGGAATVTLTSDQIPSHKHSYTPEGSVSVSSHTHGFTPSGSVSSHTHSFTPEGTVAKHKHGFTPSGSVSSSFTGSAGSTGKTQPTFTGSAVTSGGQSAGHNHSVTAAGTISGGAYIFTGSAVTSGANNRGHTHSYAHTHGYTPSGTVSSHSHKQNIQGSTYAIQKPFVNDQKTGSDTGYTLTTQGYASGSAGAGFSNKARITTDEAQPTFTGTAGTTSSQSSSTSGDESQNHTHSVTASGTISVKTNPTFSGTSVNTGNQSGDHTHQVTAAGTVSSHDHSFTPSGSVSSSFTGTAGNTAEVQPAFTGIAGTTGGTAPTFTGTAGTTGGTAPSATFTGTAGNTGDTGGGQAHNNMPPYIIKYCWERTA